MSTTRIVALTIEQGCSLSKSEIAALLSSKAIGNPTCRQAELATVNINPLPAKQPSVYRPCAGPKHDQTCSERNKQKVHTTSASTRQPHPNLDHCLQSSRNGRPQSSQQQTPNADPDESHVKRVREHSQRFRTAANQQGNGCC